jgi:hypothetical protein
MRGRFYSGAPLEFLMDEPIFAQEAPDGSRP